MEFFGIIFYIIIFAVFASAKRAAKASGEHNGHKKVSGMGENGKSIKTVTSNRPMKDIASIPNEPMKDRASIPNKPMKGMTAIPNKPNKKKQVPIFMEPHKEEGFQPKIRTNNLWGEDEHAAKRIVALRLMEGDPVPEGYTRIKCPYCAADNLVTKHCKQYHSCYFCRVPID